jgi:hypothetical protein
MPDAGPVNSPSDAEIYHTLRSQIEFEDSLITQRLSWCVASQAFLFSAYAITLNAPKEAASLTFAQQQKLLHHLVPLVGVGSCILVYLSVVAGVLAQVRLRRFFAKRLPPERAAQYPPIQGVLETRALGLSAPLGLPLMFIIIWVFLFVRGLPYIQ